MHVFAIDFSYFETRLPSQLKDGLFRILKDSACCFLAVDAQKNWAHEFVAWASKSGFDASDFVFNEITGPHAERIIKLVSIPSEYQKEACTIRRIVRSARLLHEVSVLAARKDDFRDLECDRVSVFDTGTADIQLQIKCPIHVPISLRVGFVRFGDSSGGVDSDREYIAIAEESKNQGVYKLELSNIRATSLENLIDQLIDHAFDAIHISGHVEMMGKDPVIVCRISQKSNQISLNNIIKKVSQLNIKILIVNTCYSTGSMNSNSGLNCDLVGHGGEIAEDLAQKFSSVLYKCLVSDGNLVKAAALARKAIASDEAVNLGELILGKKTN